MIEHLRDQPRHQGSSVMAMSAHRSAGLFPALLLAIGLVTLQALIGGRVVLFCLPGLCLIGAATLLAIPTASRPRVRADSFCLSATAVFFGYLLIRAWLSPDYFSRLDLFSIVGALAVYGLTATMLTSSVARAVIVVSLLDYCAGSGSDRPYSIQPGGQLHVDSIPTAWRGLRPAR